MYLCSRFLKEIYFQVPTNALLPFKLPILGLKYGIHQYQFLIEDTFFKEFDDAFVNQGNINMDVTLDKRNDMLIFHFVFSGTIVTDCDRCLAMINLPIKGDYQLIVKYSIELKEDDGDVVFIDPATTEFSIAQYAYEFIALSVPILRQYDCNKDQNPPCDFEMLNRLVQEVKIEDSNPAWDILKNLSDN